MEIRALIPPHKPEPAEFVGNLRPTIRLIWCQTRLASVSTN